MAETKIESNRTMILSFRTPGRLKLMRGSAPRDPVYSMATFRTSSLFASSAHRVFRRHPVSLLCSRNLATQKSSTSNLLSQQLDRARGKDAPNSGAPNSVGPFPLGVSPLKMRSSRDAPVKPWDQLTPGGKGELNVDLNSS